MFHIRMLACILATLVSAQNGQIYPASAIAVLTNGMRFDGRQYMSIYKNDGAGCGVPAGGSLGAMFLDQDLSNAAVAHSQDMVNGNYFDHSTQGNLVGQYGGSSFADRVKYYYKSSPVVGENIAQGSNYGDPVEVMSGWLKSPGHCVNIFGNFDRIGTGTAEGNDVYRTRAAQEFSRVGSRGSNAIAAGSHLIQGDGLKFIVAVEGPVSEVDVIVDGQRNTMQLEIGSPSNGMFQRVLNMPQGGCMDYYFEAINEGAVVDRFPPANAMQTGGFGQCPINSGVVGASPVSPASRQSSEPEATGPPPMVVNGPEAEPSVQDNNSEKPQPVVAGAQQEATPTPIAPKPVVQGAQSEGQVTDRPDLIVYTAPAPASEANSTNQVGPAVSTEPFKLNSIAEQKKRTIIGVVVGSFFVLMLMLAMIYCIRKNLRSGEKWNSPKLVHEQSKTLYRTLSRRQSPSTKKMVAVNGLPRLDHYSYPSEIVSRQASLASPFQSPGASECLSPAPLLQSELLQVRRENSWKLVAGQMRQ